MPYELWLPVFMSFTPSTVIRLPRTDISALPDRVLCIALTITLLKCESSQMRIIALLPVLSTPYEISMHPKVSRAERLFTFWTMKDSPPVLWSLIDLTPEPVTSKQSMMLTTPRVVSADRFPSDSPVMYLNWKPSPVVLLTSRQFPTMTSKQI